MDTPNPFIGQATAPAAAELSPALGPTSVLWDELLDSLAKEQGVIDQEWISSSPKYGWSLVLKLKKRRIVYLGPCAGCFQASFALSDTAVTAARASNHPKPILNLLNDAPHYAEGTGLPLIVKTAKDLPAIRNLVQFKLAN